jgi:hypothetical protein
MAFLFPRGRSSGCYDPELTFLMLDVQMKPSMIGSVASASDNLASADPVAMLRYMTGRCRDHALYHSGAEDRECAFLDFCGDPDRCLMD